MSWGTHTEAVILARKLLVVASVVLLAPYGIEAQLLAICFVVTAACVLHMANMPYKVRLPQRAGPSGCRFSCGLNGAGQTVLGRGCREPQWSCHSHVFPELPLFAVALMSFLSHFCSRARHCVS